MFRNLPCFPTKRKGQYQRICVSLVTHPHQNRPTDQYIIIAEVTAVCFSQHRISDLDGLDTSSIWVLVSDPSPSSQFPWLASFLSGGLRKSKPNLMRQDFSLFIIRRPNHWTSWFKTCLCLRFLSKSASIGHLTGYSLLPVVFLSHIRQIPGQYLGICQDCLLSYP